MADSATPAATVAGKNAEDYGALADTLRSRVDLFGKTLAGIATLGTGAVGLAKVADLAPIDDGEVPWVIGTGAALIAAAFGAIIIAARMMKVSRPVILDADPNTGDLSDDERHAVASIYTSTACEFGFTLLPALQARATALRAIATRTTTEKERIRRSALADEAKDAIDLAIARARLAVVRQRASNAVSDATAFACYTLVIVGLVMFAISADIVTSDRSDAVATAKACAEARKAGATKVDLKGSVCDIPQAPSPSEPDKTTASEARAKLVTLLADALVKCTALAEDGDTPSAERPLTQQDCKQITQALQALTAMP
jgi:hypothetical protein